MCEFGKFGFEVLGIFGRKVLAGPQKRLTAPCAPRHVTRRGVHQSLLHHPCHLRSVILERHVNGTLTSLAPRTDSRWFRDSSCAINGPTPTYSGVALIGQ